MSHHSLPPQAKVRPWNDPRVRSAVFQIIAILIVVWVGYSLFQNTLTNMASRGISTGFGFFKLNGGLWHRHEFN